MCLPPTNICLGPGLGPEVQTQTHSYRHTGDLLPSSPTVFVKDVDLLRLKGQFGLNPHHTTRPERRHHQGSAFACVWGVIYGQKN